MDANLETRESVRVDGTTYYDTDTVKKKVHNAAVRYRHAYESAEENKEKENN